MDNKPFFSIVMPIYGVEPYLRQAIDSVLRQTFQDFEIILVNDCSPDNSAEICREYSDRYENIRTVNHAKNSGVSAARNTGFAEVQGRYVWFMDPDDYVDSTLLQQVYDSLQKNKAQVVVFGGIEEYYDHKQELVKSVPICPPEAFCQTANEVHNYILDLEMNTLYGYPWNKVYSAEHIRSQQLKYVPIVLIEDIKFNVEFFDNINSMNMLPIAPYHYAKRGTTSLTAKFVPKYYEVHYERIRLLYEQQKRWGTADERTKGILATIFVRYIFSALSRNCDPRAGMNHKDRRRWLKEVFSQPLFTELIHFAAPAGLPMKVMSGLLKKRLVLLSLAVGRVIYLVQTKFMNLFVLVKQLRK